MSDFAELWDGEYNKRSIPLQGKDIARTPETRAVVRGTENLLKRLAVIADSAPSLIPKPALRSAGLTLLADPAGRPKIN